MDLGLTGKTAIVCASSKGLGFACALSLVREGASVVINGRDEDRLQSAMRSIRKMVGGEVTGIVGDIGSEETRHRLIEACPTPDILVNNNTGPAPGDFLSFGPADWQQAIEANMLAPLMMIRLVLEGMRSRKYGRIVNITSAMVKSPHPVMTLSTAARAGLTAAAKGLSRQVAADNVTINNLLPERFDTDRQTFMAQRMMREEDIDMEEARKRIAASVPANRFGKPAEFGDMCAYLCSEQAGFVTGQNIQMDGGAYEGIV